MKNNIKKIIFSFFIVCAIGFSFLGNVDFKDKQNETIPAEAQTLMKSGAKNLVNKNISEAIDDFSALTKLYPRLTSGHYNLGLAYAENNQLNNSIIEWQKTTELDENFAGAHFNLAQAYKLKNDNQKAAYHLGKYLFLKPDDKNADKIKKEIKSLQKPAKGTGIVGDIYISDKITTGKTFNINLKNIFNPKTSKISALIEINSAPKNTVIETQWGYRAIDNSIIPVNTAKTEVKGTRNIVTSIYKPEKCWPVGQYELKILVNGKENTLTQFFVQE